MSRRPLIVIEFNFEFNTYRVDSKPVFLRQGYKRIRGRKSELLLDKDLQIGLSAPKKKKKKSKRGH